MGPEQWLFLQWHEHKGSLVSTFEKLFERNTFVDCTLAAEGQYLNVHKMILSACSPYFEILLNENRDKHPIIILKDVKFRSLKSIIEYMYRGEANVLSTEMTDFLAAAETLQIKGIGKQGGGDTRTQPKNLRDLMEEQSRPPCPTMQIIKEEKDNWADSDLSSALTETVQDSFVTQNAVLFSQGDGGATIALPQKLPKGEAAAEEAEAAAPGLGSHTEPVRPAAPQPDWAGAASAGDAGPLEAAPKAEADADLPAPAPPPAPAPAPRPPPADMEDAETASLGSSVIELSDTTEEWAEEEDMDEGQAAHAHALAPAAEESRARFEAASDVARDSASRDLGSEQGGLVAVPLRCAAAPAPAHRKSPRQRKRSRGSPSAPASPAPAHAPAPASSSALAVAVRDATFSPPHRPAPAHAHAHAKARKYVCPDCHKIFLWSAHLKRHMNAHRRKGSTSVVADEGLLQKMQSVLRSLQEKEQHPAPSPPPEPAKAPRAPASASASASASATADSTAASGSERKKRRPLPPLEGESKGSAHRSSARRHNTKGYICPVCHKVFPWLCVLKSHIQSHTDVQVYRCTKCDFMTTIPHALTEHLFTHIEQEPVKCQECDAQFSSIRYLIRHINSVHGYPSAAPRSDTARSKAL